MTVASVAMYADRFRLSRLGTFLTHLSLVLMLIGAMMGRLWGWKDDQFIVAEGATREVPLAKNISVKLEQFQEEWYVEGPPKDFSSEIVIYDNGQEVKRGTTRVNSPLSYKGITFNQAFFGQVAVVEVQRRGRQRPLQRRRAAGLDVRPRATARSASWRSPARTSRVTSSGPSPARTTPRCRSGPCASNCTTRRRTAPSRSRTCPATRTCRRRG